MPPIDGIREKESFGKTRDIFVWEEWRGLRNRRLPIDRWPALLGSIFKVRIGPKFHLYRCFPMAIEGRPLFGHRNLWSYLVSLEICCGSSVWWTDWEGTSAIDDKELMFVVTFQLFIQICWEGVHYLRLFMGFCMIFLLILVVWCLKVFLTFGNYMIIIVCFVMIWIAEIIYFP